MSSCENCAFARVGLVVLSRLAGTDGATFLGRLGEMRCSKGNVGVTFDVKKHDSDCVRRNFKRDADGAFRRAAEDALIAGPGPDLVSSRGMQSSGLFASG